MRIDKFLPLLLFTSIFILTAFLVHMQTVSIERYFSDTFSHIIFLYRFIYEPDYYIPHPLWHLVTFGISKLLFISVESAAAVTSAFFVTLWTYLAYWLVKKTLPRYSTWQHTLITFSIITIGPLCLPWYSKLIFHGAGSPNIWHNVTLWAVKPFALLSVWYTLKGIETSKTTTYVLAFMSAILSIFAKPSFIIMFLPALVIFALIKGTYKNPVFQRYFFLLSGISILILFYQYIHTFGAKEASHIIIDLFGVWSLASQNIGISVFLGLAFPLLLTLFKTDILNDNTILLSWIMILIGMIYYAVFAQSGRFYSHGNFGWSYMIAMSLLYLFSIIKYFEIYTSLSLWKRYTLMSLLIVQTTIGLDYLYKILLGQHPLYISIYL